MFLIINIISLNPMISCLSRNEAPIPTHFFLILTSCGNSTFSPVNCMGPLEAKSFILPHRPDYTETCAVSNAADSSLHVGPPLWKPAEESHSGTNDQSWEFEMNRPLISFAVFLCLQTGEDLTWVEDWLKFHTARVRDVELLTGLSFYHNRLSVEQTLQLKTFLQTA